MIGLEDHTTPPDYMYYSISGLCASYCEMFALDVKFFSKIMEEKVIRSNYASLVKERKLRLVERLQLLKNNVIMQQYNFFKGNLKYINGSDEQDLLNDLSRAEGWQDLTGKRQASKAAERWWYPEMIKYLEKNGK